MSPPEDFRMIIHGAAFKCLSIRKPAVCNFSKVCKGLANQLNELNAVTLVEE
jgi:hypothetical protein